MLSIQSRGVGRMKDCPLCHKDPGASFGRMRLRELHP